jgi:oligopeptide transport system substrate-binding protein
VSACTGRKSSEGVLKLPSTADAKSLDPALADDLYTNEATSLIYEGLLEYEYLKRPHELKPLLAEAMPTISDDGLVYTFKIKKGVMFADSAHFKGGKGREVRAQDFVYSLLRIADPKINSGGYWIFDGKIKGLDAWREKNRAAAQVNYDLPVEGLQALDDHTLQISLSTPYPQLLYVLAMTYSAVVPREVVEHMGNDFGNHPVGTGPYMLERWMRGSRISYVRNPNYHGSTYPTQGEATDDPALLADAGKTLPFMDRVEIHVFVEAQPMWLNFMSGSIDRASIPKDNFETVIDAGANTLKKEFADRGIALTIHPSPDVTYVALNMLDPFIQKAGPKFRKALALAGNTEDTLRVFYNNRGIPAHSPIPPGLAGYDENFKNPYQRHDIEAAKKLLAEAGYPGGKGVPVLQYEIGQGTEARQMAEDFQRRLANLGIKVQININQFSELLSKIDSKSAMMWGIAWGGRLSRC